MAFRYAKSPVPLLDDGANIGRYQEEEARRLAGVIQNLYEGIFGLKYREPVRQVDGQLFIADGTYFNPGDGFGVYLYSAGEYYKLLMQKVARVQPPRGLLLVKAGVFVASPMIKKGKVIFVGRPQ